MSATWLERHASMVVPLRLVSQFIIAYYIHDARQSELLMAGHQNVYKSRSNLAFMVVATQTSVVGALLNALGVWFQCPSGIHGGCNVEITLIRAAQGSAVSVPIGHSWWLQLCWLIGVCGQKARFQCPSGIHGGCNCVG